VAWKDVPDEIRAQAEAALTERQLEVVKLRAGGFSWRRVGEARGTTAEAACGCFDRATLRLRKSLNE
jgi:transcriptional regulator